MKTKKYIILTLFITLFTAGFFIIIKIKYNQKYKFDTIESLKQYASFYPETYAIENNDWADPTFIKFYKNTLMQSNFKKILVTIGIKKDPLFNIQEFESLLKKLNVQLTKKKSSKNNKVLNLKSGTKCIIFGDLHGALHSLVRDLAELEKQKIIDNNLNIISPDTYIISLGDCINRAPYSLEVLNILLLLIKKNPNKVIYLRGNHETNRYWRNFNMRRQIQTLFPQFALINQKDTLPDKIDIFFKSLPEALTIKINGSEKDKILFSNEEKPKLYENNNNVKFMIIGEKKYSLIKKLSGLDFIGYTNGIATWSTMSCQNMLYKKYFNFDKDAFLELTIGPSASKSVLTLNNRDNAKPNDVKSLYKQFFYDPVFGKQLEIKSNNNNKPVYNIGSSMYLSGITSIIGNENKAGLETAFYFNNIGNKNNLIKPTILDDMYLARLAALNINTLLEKYSINTIEMPTGTPTLLSYLDLIISGKIFVFFPYTGAIEVRKKDLKNIIHFRANYNDEIVNMIKHLNKEYQIKKFAFFYTNDSYGTPIAESAHAELKKLGITEWLDLPHTRTQPNFDSMKKQIKEFMPEAIACISVQFLIEELINNLSPEFFSTSILFSLSAMNGETFERFLQFRGIKQILSSVVPDPKTSNMQIAKEFRRDMKLRGLRLSLNSFEGYIVGSLMSEAINNTPPPVTREKIMTFFENMKNYKFKGLNLTFNPENRDLSQPVWIKTQENKWIKH